MFTSNELNPPIRFLMGPGPSDVHPRVLKAMATPLVGPDFISWSSFYHLKTSNLSTK